MTCPLADRCLAPSCTPDGPLWRARSAASVDVEAFTAGAIAYARQHPDCVKPCSAFFDRAMAGVEERCLLS